MASFDASRRLYEGYAADGRRLGFAHPLHQRGRYAGALRHVTTAGRDVLDFGCGHGDLYPFLVEAGQQPRSYDAVDLIEANRTVTAERLAEYCPGGLEAAGVRVIGELDAGRDYDVTLCLATLSVREGDATRELWRSTIDSLWQRTRATLVFDVQRVEPGHGDDRHERLDPEAVAAWAARLSRNHLIDNSLADHYSLVVVHRSPTPTRRFWDARRGPRSPQ